MPLDLDETIEQKARRTVHLLYRVHRGIGPGCGEGIYHRGIVRILEREGVPFRHEARIAIEFEGLVLENALRVDFIIDDCIAVEVKAHPEIHPAHEAQLLNYLRWSGLPVGFVMSFGSPTFKQGIRRFARTSCVRGFAPSRWHEPPGENEES